MQVRSRVLPSGGSAVLEAWRQAHGPEALRQQAMASPGGHWLPGNGHGRMLPGPGSAALRSYMAASNDRLAADLGQLMSEVSGNAELRMGLKIMRRRSRTLAKDNEWVKRFLQLVRDNVVGPRGFTLQSKIYKARRQKGVLELDVAANDAIEEAYKRQSKRGAFTACGTHTRASLERMAITCLARDGEVIAEKDRKSVV